MKTFNEDEHLWIYIKDTPYLYSKASDPFVLISCKVIYTSICGQFACIQYKNGDIDRNVHRTDELFSNAEYDDAVKSTTFKINDMVLFQGKDFYFVRGVGKGTIKGLSTATGKVITLAKTGCLLISRGEAPTKTRKKKTNESI